MKKFYKLSSAILAILFVWMLTPLLGQSTCVTPTEVNVTEITETTAQVTWESVDTVEMQWYVYVYASNEGSAYGWEIFTSTDTVTLTGLEPHTNYTVHVQGYCGEDEDGESLYSDWTYGYSFSTLCGVLSVTPDESYWLDFYDDAIDCWSSDTIHGNSLWYPYSDYGYFYFGNESGYSYADDTARLLSPFFDLSGMANPQLEFQYYLYYHSMSVYYRTGMDAEWQNLVDYEYDGDNNWHPLVSFDLPVADSCQISFVAANSDGYSVYRGARMRSMKVEEGPTCLAPEDLTVDYPAANIATLSWTDINDSVPASWTVQIYDYYYGDMIMDTTVMDTFVTIYDYDITRGYKWYVKANCGENDESDRSAQGSFSTACGVYVVTPENLYQTGFENDATCWTGTSYNSYYPHSGSYATRLIGSNYLTSPFFDLTQMQEPALTFYHRQYYSNVDSILHVYYRTDESEAFQFLAKVEVDNAYRFATVALPFDTCQLQFRNTSSSSSVYLDDVMIDEMPSCVRVARLDVDTITSESVRLSWISNDNEGEWLVRIEGWGDTLVANNPATISGLQENTSYLVSIRANCPVDTSAWSEQIAFRTECGAITIDENNSLFEGFEECEVQTIPSCWGRVTGYSNSYNCPSTYDWSPFGSQKSLLMTAGASGYQNTIYTKALTNDINTLQVSFAANNNSNDGGMRLDVGVMEGNTFVTVKTFTSLENMFYERVVFNNYTGNGNRIAFRLSTTSTYYYDYYLLLDDIVVELAKCIDPVDVTVTGVTRDSAVVTWTDENMETPASWTVRLFDGYNYRDTTVTTDTVVFSDLAFGTRYTAQVRANCSAGDTSYWSDEVYFDTDCDVYVVTPDNPYIEDFETYPVCWSGSITQYSGYAHSGDYSIGNTYSYYEMLTPVFDLTALENPMLTFYYQYDGVSVYYRTRESGFWMLLDEYGYSSDYNYAYINLPNTTETYQIRFVSDYSTYIDDVVIGEEPECQLPSQLQVVWDSLTDTSVQIEWTSNGSETSWTVSVNGVETDVTENPFTITGLEPGMEYTVKVRANCSATTFSDWSDEMVFSTNCADVYVVTSTQPYHEGFENSFCWVKQVVSGSNNWYRTDTINNPAEFAHDGAQFVYAPNTSGSRALLYSPVLDLSQVSEAQMNFHVRVNKASNTLSELQVLYRTSDTTEWLLLENYIAIDTVYTRMAINLPELTATYQIGFMSIGAGVQYILLDDINVFELVPCAAPTNVTVENNVATWTGNAPSYNVKVSVNNELVAEATVNTNTYTVTGLEPGDYAIFRVQAVCDEDNISDWTEGEVFITAGIENYSMNVAVYPNPTTGVIVIEGASLNADITVFDMFGKQMMNGKVMSERTELDLSGLATGMYIIRMVNAGEVSAVKVVKE